MLFSTYRHKIRRKCVVLAILAAGIFWLGSISCDLAQAQGPNLRNTQPGRYSQPQPQPQAQPNQPQPQPQNQPQRQQPVQQTPLDAQSIAADLHGSIQRLLSANERRRPGLGDCTPDKVLAYCYPYGSMAMVAPAQGGQPVYAVGALCWNFPCQDKTLFRINGDQVIARVGYGYQQTPGSFLAMLAFSEILPDYEIKADNDSRTLLNLINTEKRNCTRGQNMSLVLTGLSFYTTPDEHWANSLGEAWSLERLVFEELSRRADQSNADVTDQLLGLAAAVRAYQTAGRPLEGPLADAVAHLETYQRFALSVQNADGTWHPMFFVSKGVSTDADAVLYSSAHILRALVYSLPQEQLQSQQVQRGVVAVSTLIARRNATMPFAQMNYRQMEGITVGLHALRIYDERVYGTNYSTSE